MDNEQKETPQEKPTLGQLWQDIKKHKKLYYKVLSIAFIVSAIIMLSIPNYYKCTVMLAPEIPGGNKGTSGLASLASSFGVNLGSASAGADAIMPNLYPDLMNSVAFRASLFPVKVQEEDGDTAMTYYDYLENYQRLPWWSAGMKAVGNGISAVISSFFDQEKKASDKVNPFRLTKEQMKIVETMQKKVVCDVDKKTFVITIDVTDQDPLIAATMADSVQTRLQNVMKKPVSRVRPILTLTDMQSLQINKVSELNLKTKCSFSIEHTLRLLPNYSWQKPKSRKIPLHLQCCSGQHHKGRIPHAADSAQSVCTARDGGAVQHHGIRRAE